MERNTIECDVCKEMVVGSHILLVCFRGALYMTFLVVKDKRDMPGADFIHACGMNCAIRWVDERMGDYVEGR